MQQELRPFEMRTRRSRNQKIYLGFPLSRPKIMNGPIFINYRRNISAHAAGRLADQLARHLEGRRLFLDVDGIEPGLDFVKVLSDQVAQCEAFIAVIGPGWADANNSGNALPGQSQRLCAH
jgi:TIR domain